MNEILLSVSKIQKGITGYVAALIAFIVLTFIGSSGDMTPKGTHVEISQVLYLVAIVACFQLTLYCLVVWREGIKSLSKVVDSAAAAALNKVSLGVLILMFF